MSMTAEQRTAFQANAGYAPSELSTLILGAVFAVVLLWGVWAMRTAYVGWAEQRINQRQFVGVLIRFMAMYVVLSFFLLS
jgi:integrating conjugative element protein (TIGR03758 family)